MDRKYVIFTVKTVTVKLYTLVVILSLFYSFSVPALTEVTASAINGTPPYISANQDRTPSDISDLLWIAIKKMAIILKQHHPVVNQRQLKTQT